MQLTPAEAPCPCGLGKIIIPIEATGTETTRDDDGGLSGLTVHLMVGTTWFDHTHDSERERP